MKKSYWKAVVPFAAAVLITGCGNNEEPEMEESSAEDTEVQAASDDDETVNEPAASEEAEEESTIPQMGAAAVMENAEGSRIGTVSFYDEGDYVKVEADIEDTETGFHGFHLHEEAICEPEEEEPFSSAGGHYNPDDSDHGEHAGDMPPLYVMEDGTAKMSVALDQIEVEQLLEDGVSVMIHEDKDNFAHIPDRYQSEDSEESGPDQDTLDTGDAGDRYACGVIEEVEYK